MTSKQPETTVLFVCVENAGRSRMAEAFFNQLAGDRMKGMSAGTEPAASPHPEVVASMNEAGVPIGEGAGRMLTQELVDSATRVIGMGCNVKEACPAISVPLEDWDLDNPKGQPPEVVGKIRDEIRSRVEHLVEELESERTISPRPRAVRVAKILAFAIVPALFVGVVAFGFIKSAAPGRRVGETMPAFELPLLGQDETFSERNLRGSPAVINFWASWCLPCRDEAPTLEQKWRKYRDQGAIVIGVNVQDAEEDALTFVEQYGLTFPVVRDVQLDLWRKLGVRGIPETFFIDHNSVFTGIGSQEQIGARGGIKVLGPVEPAVLESQLKMLVDRQRREG